MREARAFDPDWALPPGATIADLLRQKNLSVGLFSQQLEQSLDSVNGLLSGDARITTDVAAKLHRILGGSVTFWLRRDAKYVERSQRVAKQEETATLRDWLRQLPIADMVRFGWIEKRRDVVQQTDECLRFFGIPSIQEWGSAYRRLGEAVAFRTSEAFEAQPGAVAAWLRQGEVEAEQLECGKWDATAFKGALLELRSLTRIKSPQDFLPELQKQCAACGVAVVIVRSPTGCRASGATRFLSRDKAILLLSFRYKTDDHFWFSFFHEAGHLLLHGRDGFFVEGAGMLTNKEEDEANEFAARTLIPDVFEAQLLSLGANYRSVMRFARRIGIAPGIVVGQLQHNGLLARRQLNYLKTRYVWKTE